VSIRDEEAEWRDGATHVNSWDFILEALRKHCRPQNQGLSESGAWEDFRINWGRSKGVRVAV